MVLFRRLVRLRRIAVTCVASALFGAGAAPAASGQTPADQSKASPPSSGVDFRMEEHPTVHVGSNLEVRVRARLETSFRRWSLPSLRCC